MFSCRKCKETGHRLSAHHLKSFAYLVHKKMIKRVDEAVSCKELWDLNNGVTLCVSCHKETPNYSFRAMKYPIDTNKY